jgi:hypothetical protein
MWDISDIVPGQARAERAAGFFAGDADRNRAAWPQGMRSSRPSSRGCIRASVGVVESQLKRVQLIVRFPDSFLQRNRTYRPRPLGRRWAR